MGAPVEQLTRLLVLAMAAGFALSPRLWVSTRSYPLVPVSRRLPAIPYPLDLVVFGALWLLLGLIVLAREPGAPLVAFLAVAAGVTVGDQSRWQPWFYQYVFMLAAIAVHAGGGGGEAAALNTCRLIVASIYFWSGLQKANASFARATFPWLIGPVTRGLPARLSALVAASGPAVAAAEAVIGVGLVIAPVRDVAVLLAIAMHAVILFCLGPLGHRFNTVVWPWNVAMVGFLFVLFWHTPDVTAGQILSLDNGAFHGLVVVLFGALPALSFVNCWDAYLSGALYSANVKSGAIYVTEAVRDALPEGVRPYVERDDLGRLVLRPSSWSSGEMNVPVYPEVRVFKAVARAVCRYATVPSTVELTIDYRSLARLARWRSSGRPSLRMTVRYRGDAL